jgi:imidazolonepropionase-like amidohydrolase
MAITGISVVDVTKGEILENQSVLIQNGTIERMVSNEGQAVTADVIIDGSGKYLIPGLWDMHVHFRGGDSLISENKHLLNLFLANGITGVRDAGGDITPAVIDWQDAIAKGDLKGPRIFTSGPKLDGPDAAWAGSLELESPEEVPAAFDSLESIPVDFVKLYDGSISREVYLSAIAEAEKRGLPVTGHMPFTVKFREAVKEGLDATEHMYYVLKGTSSQEDEITEEIIQRKDTEDPLGFWEVLPRILSSYDSAIARETYTLMKEHKTAVVPTLHIGEVLAYMTEVDHTQDEYLDYLGPGIIKTYDRRFNAAQNSSEEAKQERRDLQDKFVELAGEMNKAGVTILAGSDSGPFNSFTYPGLSLHKELQALVEAGLSPAEALRSATINGAAFFNLEKEYGQVKEGFAADLVLLDSNPLEDIRNTQDIHAVIWQGKRVFPASELRELLQPNP